MVRVGINGFGRMGRLAVRSAWGCCNELEVVVINDPNTSAKVLATLLEFDSVQGRWDQQCHASGGLVQMGGRSVPLLHFERPGDIPWRDHDVELVLECSGRFRTTESLRPHLTGGAQRVVVSAPVKDGPPNIVVGVNHQDYDLANAAIVTAASCTTNALAPIVRVLHDQVGIRRGHVTTIHNPTNTQSVLDAAGTDPRRSRASQLSLIPTSTNSAYAVTQIVPELRGKLDSIAIRAPVMNASLVDCVFQVAQDTTPEEINRFLERASQVEPLRDILGYEERPLVSVDYARDPRSSVVDALSTRVTDGSLVKVLAWYDNEWGYANRFVELAAMVASSLSPIHA